MNRLVSKIGRFGADALDVVSASGSHIRTSDGRTLLDGQAGYWCVPLGYSHPRVVSAVTEMLGTLSYAHLVRRTHAPARELAERLAQISPHGSCARVLCATNGTDAVEAAMGMVLRWARPRHRSVLVLERGFHGESLGLSALGDLSSGGSGRRRRWLGGLDAVRIAPAIEGDGDLAEALRALDEAFARHRPAAILIEPVQLAAGARVVDDAWLRRVAALCAEHDSLLVADEVASGMGRTGRFFASEHAGVCPDLTIFGKGITAGHAPLAGVLVGTRPATLLEDREFRHGHTFSWAPPACAAALAALDVVLGEGLEDRAASLGIVSKQRLLDELGQRPVRVRGRGLAIGVELPGTSAACAGRRAAADRGVVLGQEGPSILLVPPLNIRQADLDELLEVAVTSIRAALDASGSAQLVDEVLEDVQVEGLLQDRAT